MTEHVVELVGRVPERARVDEALAGAAEGSAAVLLVGGPAGIGKTAVVRYAADMAGQLGYQVLEGTCLDIAASVPFGPVLEAVRPVLTTLDGPVFRAVQAMYAGVGDQAPISPGHALEALRQVVTAAATVAPVLLILEDMHWAEQSTRDFAVALSGQLAGPVVVMLTFRSDDLHRRHPFRSCLLDLTRSGRCTRIDLEPLDRAALAELVALRTGEPPDPGLVGALLARSEGNPLYAEELLARAHPAGGLPERLADLLLARMDALSEPSRRLLRAASVHGSRLDVGVLATVLGLTEAQLDEALREAVDRNVLVRRSGHLEFWHGLLREAVYDDLLPGERTRLHTSHARALQAALDTGGHHATTAQAGQVAYHWYAAHDLPRAFAASVLAGRLAGEYGAPEASTHLGLALDLWDQVPDAEAAIGMVRADLLRLAAEAAHAGMDLDRSLAIMDEAIGLLEPGGDPLLASRVYAARGNVCRSSGDTQGQRDAVNRAVELAEGTASVELAHALAVKARYLSLTGRPGEARAVGHRAADLARRRGSAADEALATFALGAACVFAGEPGDGFPLMRSAVGMAERCGRLRESMTYQGNLAWLLLLSGRPDEAVACAREGADRGRNAGLPASALFCAEQEVEVLAWTGDLERGEMLLQDLVDRGLDMERAQIYASLLAAHRGDLEPAASGLAARYDRDARTGSLPGSWDVVVPWVDVCLDLGRTAEALRAAADLVAAMSDVDSPVLLAQASRVALASVVAGRAAGTPMEASWPTAAERVVERAEASGGGGQGTMAAAQLASARAWRHRLHGRVEPQAWQAAVDAWRDTGYHFGTLAPQVHLAEDLLTLGDRARARDVVEEVWAASRSMGARKVAEDVAALARRARFTLPAERRPPPGPLDRLTPREREVLDLVSSGSSNRSIAAALFISEKTVSVHVSNLMAKLGVSSRLEAAAVAHQLSSTAAGTGEDGR